MVYKLRLYVTGTTASSQRAIANLKQILKESGPDQKFDLEIIDIIERPQLAEDEKIIATPVLIKKLPLPVRKIIGDLSDEEKVLLGLDLVELADIKKEL